MTTTNDLTQRAREIAVGLKEHTISQATLQRVHDRAIDNGDEITRSIAAHAMSGDMDGIHGVRVSRMAIVDELRDELCAAVVGVLDAWDARTVYDSDGTRYDGVSAAVESLRAVAVVLAEGDDR